MLTHDERLIHIMHLCAKKKKPKQNKTRQSRTQLSTSLGGQTKTAQREFLTRRSSRNLFVAEREV